MAINKKQRKELEEYFVTHSQESNRTIAKKFGLTHPTISKIREEFYAIVKSEFVQSSIKHSIFEIRRSVEHWKLLIEKLYKELETNEKEVILNSGGKQSKVTIALEPMERMRIINSISDLEVKIQEWGNDPEISQILKVMDSGQVQ